MRLVHLAAAAAAVFTLAATPAAACCHRVRAFYGVAPVVPLAPPAAFDPWYQVRQIYVVNQGPVFTGPGIYAYSNFYVPTVAPPLCCGGGFGPSYPYAPPFPYVRGEIGCHGGVERCAYWYGYRRHWRGPYAAYGHRHAAGMIRPRPH